MEGILELDEIQLTAVYSRNLEKGKQFAAKLVPIVANLIIDSPPSYILYFIIVTV